MKTKKSPHHWEKISNLWQYVGSPLRPGNNDIAAYQQFLGSLISHQSPRVLVLGVTPEFYNLPWQEGAQVMAADQSIDMIRSIWPGPEGSARLINWLELSAHFEKRSLDVIFLDGGLHLLNYHQQGMLSKVLSRLLKPQGRLLIRFFLLPEKQESIDEVFQQLEHRQVPSVHVFKMKLGMALQRSPEEGVQVQDIYDKIIEWYGDLESLHWKTQWPLAEVLTLTSYFESKNRYHFTTEEESCHLLQNKGGFCISGMHRGKDYAAKQFPIFSFTHRD